MSNLVKVTDQLMGLTISELTQVQSSIQEVKTMKAKSALTVGANVFVVQKTKKTPGVVEKINQTRAIVNMKGRSYNVPFSMLVFYCLMTIKAKGRPSTTVIDLDGSQGNAFVLLGYANQTMKESGFDKETKDNILNEMKSGDYINLLRTFEKYFGSVYTLQTSNPEYLDAFMVEKSA